MASTIQFKMNNLTVNIVGVNGYMDTVTYTNFDPVIYVFKMTNIKTGEQKNFTFTNNKTTTTNVEGFSRARTDEVYTTFQGAYLPGA